MTLSTARFAGYLIAVAVVAAFLIATARGADPTGRYAQSPLRDWFNSLKSPLGGLCCSMADGHAIDDPDWDVAGGRYRVYLENEWIVVPEGAVVTGANRFGRAIVWPVRQAGRTVIRCFMPGAEG